MGGERQKFPKFVRGGGPFRMNQMQIPVFQVDAFTEVPFRGNPAAVCPLDSWLDDGLLHKVAVENNLPATAFLVPNGEAYDLRWFSPRCELRLCGHATLATGSVVLNFLAPGSSEVRFETRAGGSLTVRKESDLYAMNFPALPPQKTGARTELANALGLRSSPTEVLEVNQTYIAVLESQKCVEDIRPNFDLLEKLHPYAVAATAVGKEADCVSRYFAPGYGIAEDAVTGSLHCALTPYWSARLGKSRLRARQLSERGGELFLEMAGERVVIRGGAVLVRKATLMI